MARKGYIVGSGNLFEDLGHQRPAEALAKAELARKIGMLIAKRGLTQTSAADLLKIDQPKISARVRVDWPDSRSIDSCDSSYCSATTWKSSASRARVQPKFVEKNYLRPTNFLRKSLPLNALTGSRH